MNSLIVFVITINKLNAQFIYAQKCAFKLGFVNKNE
jgi:hypothetical protein